MKHKSKKRLRKSRKSRKTKRRQMRGGGFLDHFMTTSVGIPGVGSVGKCQSKDILENGVWKEQKCYITPFGKVYKTVQPDTAAT